jgi:PPP family 3-phenylpropionic acid transporter
MKSHARIRLAFLNGKYAALQGSYWMAYCVLGSFAALFLIQKKYTDFEIGIILAAGSVLAVFLQFVLASLADSFRRISVGTIVTASSGTLLATSIALSLLSGDRAPVAGLIVANLAILVMMQPFINSLCFLPRTSGDEINFGLARGIGSLSYALTAVLVGKAVKLQGASLVPLFFVVTSSAFFLFVLVFQGRDNTCRVPIKDTRSGGSIRFARTHTKFLLFSVSVFFIFFDHSLINNFFVRIIMNVHGDIAQMGNCLGLAAILELPVMIAFWFFKERIRCTTALKLSGTMFLLKHLVTFCAHSVKPLYVAQFFQLGAFALFIPAATYYAEQTLSPRDLVKGQTFIMGAITLSGVFASLFGGLALERYGVTKTLFIGLCVSAVGTVTLFASLVRSEHGNDHVLRRKYFSS